MRGSIKSALAFAGALAVGSMASAQTFWANWSNAPAPNTVVTFNAATPGLFSPLPNPTGIPGTQFVNGCEFDGTGTNLYLTTNQSTGFLWQVNMITGVATQIGGTGLSGTDSIGDLSWDPVGNRMLAVGTAGVAGSGARLYEVALGSGSLTLLGTINGMTEGFAVSLAVRNDGAIYVHGIETDRWYSVDNLLNATPLGLLGVDTNFGQGATFVGSTLYHAMLTTTGGNQNRLATIDLGTGLPTFLGTLGGPGLTQLGDIASPIPEPTSLALIGLGGLALLARRRNA
jgi:hypothetical protein